jgi:hypothetical protein
MQYSFNELYLQFCKGQINNDELAGLIYQNLLDNQEIFNYVAFTYDEYEDFVSWLYPRLCNGIKTYSETGSSFEVYMMTVIKLAQREFKMKTTEKRITEYAAWSVQVSEQYAFEESPEYLSDKTRDILMNQITKLKKNPRQLLTLVLKCYTYLSDDFLDKIIPYLGVNKVILNTMIERLRIIRAKRDDKIYHMKEKIHSLFYRCIVLEKKLSYTAKDSFYAARIKVHLEKTRKRLNKMRARLSSIKTDATNKEVAEIIGITKGCVDSSLFNLKNRWNKANDKSMFN